MRRRTGIVDHHRLEEGVLPTGHPYRAVGEGRPLFYFPPFAPVNTLATGFGRWIELRLLRSFASGGFRVTAVNRRVGLRRGVTMRDLAAQYAEAVTTLGGPVDVLGFSTGGAVALTFAIEHPSLIRRLVVASAAHRLSQVGWQACRTAADRAAAGDRGGFGEAMAPAATASPIGRDLTSWFGRRLTPLLLPSAWDPTDAVATLEADLTIDIEDRLDRITAPTLVVGGDRDPSYPVELVGEMVARIPNVTRLVYAGTGHGVVMRRRFTRDLAAFLLQSDR